MKKIRRSRLKNKILNGFTLIELLVVISIIGILTGISLVSFVSSQKQARDSVRRSDLKQYQNALESYANLSNGLFPSRPTVSSAYTTLCSDLNVILSPAISCSQDPKTLKDATYYDYKYISNGIVGTASATNYILWAKLESSSTVKYVVYCSNGKIGTDTVVPSSSVCPATLTQL